MKALLVPEQDRLELDDVPPPEPGPYDALVRMEACGICNSTDAKLIDGQMYWAPPFPFVLGHESVGTVVEIGPKVRKFRVGDRVTRPVAFWPGSRSELNVATGGFAQLGIVRDGAAMAADGDPSLAADYTVLRQNVVPPELTARDAALAISLSETASVLRHLPNLRGKKVVVAGTGVVGYAFGLWVKLAGGFVITLGRREERLNQARALGADVTINTRDPAYRTAILDASGGPVDGAIEATGDLELARELIAILKPEGFASAYGVPPTGQTYDSRWITSIVEEHLSYAWVANLLIRGWIKPEWFVSHMWTLDESLVAFEEVGHGRVVKGFIQMPS